ncbi:MAG: RNA polymerase sigma factor [Candidatus Dormibacteria bacterium]
MDEDLLVPSRRLDASAFEALARRHQDGVFNLAWRYLGNREDALDVTQEALTRAWVALPRLGSGEAFKPWLYRIAVNLCHDRGRSLARHPEDPLPDNVVRLAAPDPGPEALALRHERWEMIAAALTRLRPEFRAAVLLRDVGDLSYEEVAAALDVPVGTVRSRICRGRAELRVLLAGRLGLTEDAS